MRTKIIVVYSLAKKSTGPDIDRKKNEGDIKINDRSKSHFLENKNNYK